MELVDILNSFTELVTLLKFWKFIGKIWTYSVESKKLWTERNAFFSCHVATISYIPTISIRDLSFKLVDDRSV